MNTSPLSCMYLCTVSIFFACSDKTAESSPDLGTDSSAPSSDTSPQTDDTIQEEPTPAPSYTCGNEGLYDPIPIGEWKVCRAKNLHSDQPETAAAATALLTENLTHLEQILEPNIILFLQNTYIWLEKDLPAFPGAVYHPSGSWLVNNGYPEYWAKGLQIGNASNYLSWTSIQPAMILHELSHAWHHQKVGYDQAEIGAAYDAAVASGIYNNVEYAGGGTQSAYALTNKQEYFAELTEAYFWQNDFYPFTKDQLASFDPQGFQVIQQAWAYE